MNGICTDQPSNDDDHTLDEDHDHDLDSCISYIYHSCYIH